MLGSEIEVYDMAWHDVTLPNWCEIALTLDDVQPTEMGCPSRARGER